MSHSLQKLKTAIITDWMLAPGGSDRLMISILKLFPEADIFTAIYNPKLYKDEFRIKNRVYQTFLAKMPFKGLLSRHYNALTPFAFENLQLSGYDLVISLSAGAAKSVITGLNQPHVAIILTPPRFLWDGERNLRASKARSLYSFVTPFVANWLRLSDLSCINRIDHMISISRFIQSKVKRIYKRDSEVISPGVSEYWYADKVDTGGVNQLQLPERFFITVSRLYDYKRIDWSIKACIKTGSNLLVIGRGPDAQYLKELVPEKYRTKIHFLGWQPDDLVRALYKQADAFLFAGVEDFGYVPIEAMAAGCPVVAFNDGGIPESIKVGLNGELFDSEDSLLSLIKQFDPRMYNRREVSDSVIHLSEKKFHDNLMKFLGKKL